MPETSGTRRSAAAVRTAGACSYSPCQCKRMKVRAPKPAVVLAPVLHRLGKSKATVYLVNQEGRRSAVDASAGDWDSRLVCHSH